MAEQLRLSLPLLTPLTYCVRIFMLTLVLTCLQYKSFENTVAKGEIARKEQFILFPKCFLLFWRNLRHVHRLKIASSFSLEESKICCLEKG